MLATNLSLVATAYNYVYAPQRRQQRHHVVCRGEMSLAKCVNIVVARRNHVQYNGKYMAQCCFNVRMWWRVAEEREAGVLVEIKKYL